MIFGQKNGEKMAKAIILLEQFLAGMDSECFETYSKTKTSKSKKTFPVRNFFLGLTRFLAKMVRKLPNWKYLKFLHEKIKVVENLTGDHFYVFDIEFRRKKLPTRHLEFFL